MIILSSAYLAPIQYYAHIYADDDIVEDRGENFLKQTYRNRCYIATSQGALALTLPIVHETVSHIPVGEIRLSDHGNWRRTHWNALQTAYDNSPYFMYYADDFYRIYQRSYEYLVDFNEAFEKLILDILMISCTPKVTYTYIVPPFNKAIDLREIISPKVSLERDPYFIQTPYYQIFAPKTGFLPNLSIVDLLFNLGPESRIVLRNSLKIR